MSSERNDGVDAMRYALEDWQRRRDELLSRPTFCVQGIIDKCQPLICDMVEKSLKRKIMEGIEEVLCDGEYHVVRILRQEEIIPPLVTTTYLRSTAEVRVTYRAELSEVQHRNYQVADEWYDYKRYKKSTGRNHRKKDRAKARRIRAERKKLAERLKA